MKLLPELPTEEMLNALTEDQDESGGALPLTPSVAYGRLYAAAPEMKDEPVAWALYWNPDDLCRTTVDESEAINWLQDALYCPCSPTIVPLYAAPPETEKLKAEIERLRNLLDETARHLENTPMSMCVMGRVRLIATIKALSAAP